MSTTTKDEILPLLKKVFSCEFEFENNKLLLLDKVSLPNSQIIKEIIDFIKKIIKDKKETSKIKFMALRFLKDAMDLKNKILVDYVSVKLLKRLGLLAEYNRKSNDPNRGRTLFGANADQEASQNFFNLLLECLKHWKEMYSYDSETKLDSNYKKLFNSLTKKDVIFPERDYFFVSHHLENKTSNSSADLFRICDELESIFSQIINLFKNSDYIQCQNCILSHFDTIQALSQSLEPLINNLSSESSMERAVENLIFSNFLLKNFKGNEFSEFASQLLRLWGDRKSKVSSDFEFFKPSLQNNIKVIQSEGFIDKKAIDINSPSNNASVDNSRGGFGADMISKQFYTNELKELNFEEKEQVKQNFEDVFADFKKDTHSISKQSGSEFENFLGFGEGQGTMNNNENNKEETFFFDEIKKNEIKHENSYNYNFGNEYNDNNDYNFNKKNSNDQNFITSGDFQEFNFQTRTPENNQNFFQAPQDNNTNSINFFNEFNQGENIQNTFEKLGPSQNQPVMDKNPFEQFEGVKNDINLNDFGDFENFNDKSKSQENSLEEIKKLAKSNESNPFTINKSSKFDVPKKNSDIMDFWSQDIDQKPENSQNSPEIIPNKKPETDIITEDFFDNFQDFQSENSENQENSSEFFYNNTKNENNNELKLSQLTKTGQKEKNPENLYQNSSDFFNFTEPNPFEKKPSENFQNDNPFDKKQSDNFQAQTQNEENKLDFWENLKITQKFQSLKGPSGTVNPNQGINILDKYEDMQRTPSSLHRGSFEDDDFHKMVNSNDFSKKIDILPENNQKLRRSLTAFSPKENENIEIKLNSQRSMKFINEKEEIKNTDSIKFINDLEELKISQEKNSFDLITSPEIQLNSNNPNLNLNYDLLTLDRKEMEIQEPFNKKNVLTQNPDFLPYDDLDTSSKTGKILAQSFQNSSLPLKENIENIYNPDNFDLISSQNHKNTYETFDNFQQLQSFPNQPLNLMEDFFVDTEKNTQNSNNSLEKPKWIIDLDPNQIDKNTDLIIFSDQNSEGKKASDFNNNEEFLDFPTETDTEQLITPEPDMFQDFKKVDFLEENLIEENKKQIPIKFVNSLRSNDFAIKQELSSIQEDNEEYDIGNNDFMIKNKPTSIQEVNKEYDISSNSLNPKDIESLKNENLKINNRMNELNGLKADFVESKALNQINEEKINSILNDIQTLKQENQIIVKLSQDDNKKIQEKLVLKHENKFNILETNLEQMKEIYKGIKDEQESLKNELKFTIDQQAIIMQPDASIKSIKEDMKELNEKCIKTEQISLKIITKLSSDIESLQDQQKDLEIGYKKNLKNYEVLFDSTKQLLEKVEINSLPLHKELTNEFKKNENDIGKIQENYSSLKTELKSVLQEFQKEVEVIKSGREDDSNKNNKRIVEYQEISKQKLTSIENTINSFKTQFESLKDFYEVLQKDLTKITKLITLDQELSRSKIIKSQSPSQIEPSTQEKKVEEKPTRLFSESPNKRTNKITNSVFSISITPPKNEDKQKYKDIKNETVKKIIRNPANISNSIDYNSHQKKEFLNDTKLSFTDFKEKQIKVDMSHQIMISPLRNNPLENIEKFCNEFTQQDTHGREQFLKKTLKGNNYLKQVWQDPYAILNDYEEKNQNSKSNIFNFSGDVNISINQTTENRQNNNNLSYTDYQMIYGSNNNNRFNGSRGNVRNPNFYICQEKFKRKIVYVSKRYLAKLIKRMNTASSIFKIDVKNFKKACLNTSTILFENNEVLIGSKTKVQGNQIKVSLFISNKTQLPLNHLMLKLQARNRNLRLKMNPVGDIKIDLFQPKFSVQQEIFIECSPEETFEFLLADVFYYINFQQLNQKQMSLPLPFCLFKFLEYPFNIPVDFKGKWKQSKKNLISTEPLKINIELIRNYEDILNIFPNAQFLNKNPHDSITKWGVFLSLFGKIFFQMKMIFFEKYVLILQITSEENNSEIVMRIKEEILANLEFILCE